MTNLIDFPPITTVDGSNQILPVYSLLEGRVKATLDDLLPYFAKNTIAQDHLGLYAHFRPSLGRWISSSPFAGVDSTNGEANRLDLVQWTSPFDFESNKVGVTVIKGSSGAKGTICIYESDSSGKPDVLLTTAEGISLDSADFVSGDMPTVLFKRNKVYWFGHHYSDGVTLAAVPMTNAKVLDYSIDPKTGPRTIYRRDTAYGNPPPSVFNPEDGELYMESPPLFHILVSGYGP